MGGDMFYAFIESVRPNNLSTSVDVAYRDKR